MSQELFRKWIGEYCAPVVVTTTSAEAEKVCLRNGLLLHELLSCFGHLDGINATIRVPGQMFPLPDAHIRFERVTEVKPKSSECIEQLLGANFTSYDVDKLPVSLSELKASPPTAWTQNIEQIVMRSMSFSEFEMMSHPVLILTAVSTADADPVAAMQELASIHHAPACLTNGQYEPLIQRVYVLIDDAGEKSKDAFAVLRSLSARFPPASTKLISINSFTAAAPNLQQPDMWSRFIAPKFFPEHAPHADLSDLPRDAQNNRIVLGNRLSVEDFMKLREFCIWLFNEQIVPALEKRLVVLGKLVNDSRRGVKNVLKSFWRKPREETVENSKGGVKYRYDKIETQTLLLADTAFMVKDYETAVSMYKSVRDDYKADKSTLHLAYALLMIAACQILTEPHKFRETQSYLESMSQCLLPSLELLHSNAALALLAAEMHVASNYGRAPLESARILLVAAQNVSKYPLLSGLLIERAGLFMLQAFQTRRYVFHSILSANKIYRCGPRPAKHAMTCFAAAIMLLERGNWGDMKNKLSRALAQSLKSAGTAPGMGMGIGGGVEGKQRSLVLLLKILASIVNESKDVCNQNGLMDAVAVLNEISEDGGWGSIRVNEGWSQCPSRDVLLGCLPIASLEGSSAKAKVEVCGLSVPEIDMQSLSILEPINGFDTDMLLRNTPHVQRQIALMKELLAAEIDICSPSPAHHVQQQRELAQRWAKIERDHLQHRPVPSADSCSRKAQIPLGEKLLFQINMHNKLPVDLRLLDFCVGIDQSDCFEIKRQNANLAADKSLQLLLEAHPSTEGSFSITHARWNLSESLMVKQLLSTRGPLQHRTLKQRAHQERAVDCRLQFDVVAAAPLLRMSFEGLSAEALQGQLVRSRLRICNEGAATAADIYLKTNHPWFLFFMADEVAGDVGTGEKCPLVQFGCSNTVLHLDGISIAPGKEIQLDAWLRMQTAGAQNINLLAVYAAEGELINSKSRSSFVSLQMHCLPCANLSVQLMPTLSSTLHFTLVTEVANMFKSNFAAINSGGLPRASSLMQTDRPDVSSRHAEVDENCAKMVGLRLLGAVQLRSTKQHPPAVQLDDAEFKYLTSPGERVTECHPVSFFTPLQSAGKITWLLPLSPLEEDGFCASAGKGVQLLELLDGFQCLWYRVHSFTSLVSAAALFLELEEVEADVSGPRSIQEVRRERQLREADVMEEVDLDGSGRPKVSSCCIRDAQCIADSEAAGNALSVAMVWVCRWRNKIRWGLHHMPKVSYVSEQPATSSLDLASSALQFSISHVQSVELVSEEAKPAVKEIEVKLAVRSFINADSILQIRVKSDASPSAKGASSIRRGVAFVGQVNYTNVTLAANGETVLTFQAQISSIGVHNLNRFEVLLVSKDGQAAAERFQEVLGHSFIYVD